MTTAPATETNGSSCFDGAAFRAARRRLKSLGWLLVWGGFVLMTLDFETGFPTPMRGPRVMTIWLPVIGWGVWLLAQGYRLPLREVLLLADRYDHRLDIPTLMRELYVSPEAAERILDAAVKRFGHQVVTVAADPTTRVKIYTFYPPLDHGA